MIHFPYPGLASRYVKRIIKICGCVKDEKSAIIHCAMVNFVYTRTCTKNKKGKMKKISYYKRLNI